MSQIEPLISGDLEVDNIETDIFDMVDPEWDARREALAEADVAAGRLVPHERVREWLLSLGTPDQLPTPYSWRK